MATVVDICNTALSHIGDRATLTSIDPPEGTAQAAYCARFWPIARDEMLAMHDWGFARQADELTSTNTGTHPSWEYAFELPADFLVARDLMLPAEQQLTLAPVSVAFELGSDSAGDPVIYTNTDEVALVYTRQVTSPAAYPSKFTTAVGYLLASYLAGPIVKGRAGVQTAVAMRQMAEKLAGEAAVVDANQSSQRLNHKPAGLRARRAGQTSIVEQGQYRHELPFWAQ